MNDKSPDALSAHVAECDECRAGEVPVERIATALRESTTAFDAAALSQRTLVRLRPELERRAAAVLRRQVVIGLLLALLPLPAVLAYNAYVLELAYELAASVIPAGLAAMAVASYAAFLLLLFAMTYAAIPLLLARGGGARPMESV